MFRFTIRDVLWLTVVVALAVGWCVDNRLNSRYRVGPPEWHDLLRAIVQDLQQRPDIDIRSCESVCVGVMTESGTMHWRSVDYRESD